MIEDNTLILPDGRALAYARYGDPEGHPIAYCHGLPSSRLEAELASREAKRSGLQLLAIDRPGYGLSDPLPPATIAHWPEDLERLADHLRLDRLSVMGVSGGGAYALACAWHLPERIDRVLLVCPLGPVFLPRLRQPMSPAARLAFFLADRMPGLLPIFFGNVTARILRRRPQWVISLMEEGMPEKDRQVLTDPPVRATFIATIREGLRQDASGALRDFIQHAHPWGFKPADISQPVSIWHGSADSVVPVQHSRHLQQELPKAELHIVADEGHYSLPVNHARTILSTCHQESIGKAPQAE